MVRKDAETRRREVLDETLNQIGELGLANVRVADVATAMGVSPPLIVYHFATKEQLLREAVVHATEGDLAVLADIVGRPGTPVERLTAALDWYAPTGDARGWRIWLDAWSAALRDDALAEVIAGLQGRWVEEIAALIREGVAAGDLATPDPVASATRITASLDGLAVRLMVREPGPDRDEVRAWLVELISTELRARRDSNPKPSDP